MPTVTGIKDFDGSIGAAQEWIDDLTLRLGWHDREKVFLALVATLHALRDNLPIHEAVFLGDYLPVTLRGLYYEGWHMPRYSALRTREAFLERILEGLHRDPGVDAEQVAKTVLPLLADRIPAIELEDVRAVTPKALRGLWPA
jgi:uncharacterized protein (DUF2267 family)